jgi:large subunit ribosomal protein L30
MAARLRVTQVKSTISHIARNRATIRALGLKRIGDTVEVTDNPATRGMVRQVRFLVTVEEVGGEPTAAPRTSRGAAATDRSEDRGDAPATQRPEDDAPASQRPEEDASTSEPSEEETT